MGINYTDIAPSQYRDVDLRKLRTVMASVIGGIARKKLLLLSDSQEMARGGGSGATGEIGARVHSPSNIAAARLNAIGIPTRCDAWFGNANTLTGSAADYSSYNPDVTFGAGWASTLTSNTLGGCYWNNSTTTNPIIFTPQRAADRFDLIFVKSTGSGDGQFTVTDTSGTLATIDENVGTLGVYKQTISRTIADTTPISIQRNGTGTNVYIGGCDPWNSTLPELCILNAAISGGLASSMVNNSSALNAAFAINVIAAEYHLIEYGLNEKQNSVPQATLLTNLQILLTDVLTFGGGALAISAPATSGSGYNLTPDWRAAINALALTNGVPCLDHYSRFVSREVDTSVYFDLVHCTAPGYAIKGANLARMLLSAT